MIYLLSLEWVLYFCTKLQDNIRFRGSINISIHTDNFTSCSIISHDILRSLNKEALYYITKITREIKNSKYDSQHITENNAKNFNLTC